MKFSTAAKGLFPYICTYHICFVWQYVGGVCFGIVEEKRSRDHPKQIISWIVPVQWPHAKNKINYNLRCAILCIANSNKRFTWIKRNTCFSNWRCVNNNKTYAKSSVWSRDLNASHSVSPMGCIMHILIDGASFQVWKQLNVCCSVLSVWTF